jgi:6-phosphogluconate dehydrogenase
MELGTIELGPMGSNMVQRNLRAGHQSVVYDLHSEAVQSLVKEGAIGAKSLGDCASKLKTPRIVWMIVPAAVIDPTLTANNAFLSAMHPDGASDQGREPGRFGFWVENT